MEGFAPWRVPIISKHHEIWLENWYSNDRNAGTIPGSQEICISSIALALTIISLGPFFIKLGQALSIRPDLLSPRAMLELQQLCDKVPCFDSTLAMKIIEAELKKPINEIYSSISLEPIAAASLGQVLHTITYKNSSLSCIKHA